MTNVKDIISAIVTAMKPSFSGAVAIFTQVDPYDLVIEVIPAASMRDIFVGMRLKLTANDGTIWTGAVSAITGSNDIQATMGLSAEGVSMYEHLIANPTAKYTVAAVLTYHHGHPLEIVNTFKQATHSTAKGELFPAVCLLHDFPEKITFDREATVTVIILTDTDPAFTAADRYTYSYDTILTPLYELFIKKLAASTSIASTLDAPNLFEHTKYDRLYWGKSGLYGNTANIFNDFIDAIEIENLKFKTLKTC